MKSPPKSAWYVAAILLAVILLAVKILVSNGKEDGNTIILGAVLSLSLKDKYGINGNNTYNGYELAVERINEKGGVRVGGEDYTLKLVTYDDESDPKLARELVERMIKEDGVEFMLGPYSSEMTKAVDRVTRNYTIPLVVPGAASGTIFNHKYIFGLLSTCGHYMEKVVELATEKAKEEGKNPKDLKIAIAVQNDRFSLCIRNAVLELAKKYEIKIVIDEKFSSTIIDLSGVFKKVREKTPDILMISGHSKGAEAAVLQMKEMSIDVPTTAITHCEAARIIEKFGIATEGIYCPAQWAPTLPYEGELFGTAMVFSEAMKLAYPQAGYTEVPYQAASAAAAVIVWKDAFERANSFDTEKLREALAKTDLMTFYGRIKFAPTGEIISKPMALRRIRNGKYVVVKLPESLQEQ